jgi:ribosomal protein S18 acetylase RimI-like enzyme
VLEIAPGYDKKDLRDSTSGMELEMIPLIRRAKNSDLDVIAGNVMAMALESRGIDLCPENVRQAVRALFRRSEMGFYVVAESRGDIVGSLLVTFEWSDWHNGMYWWIQSVYVRPDQRRKGMYRRLYEYVRGRAASDPQVVGLSLYVDKDNDVACRVYEALGMRESHSLMYHTPDLKRAYLSHASTSNARRRNR